MRKAKPEKPVEYTEDGLWQRVLAAMPKALGFSAERLPMPPLHKALGLHTIRFRVNGPTTVWHRTGHWEYTVDASAGQPFLDNMVAYLVAWAREDRP